MRQTAQWANKPANAKQSAAILEKYTKIHVSPSMKRTIYAERLNTADIQPLVDAAAKYKSIKNTFPAADLIATGT